MGAGWWWKGERRKALPEAPRASGTVVPPRSSGVSLIAMDHQEAARERQWQVWSAMTPAERLRLMGRMTAQAVGCREARLRELHPEADETRLRELRIAATLASSPSTC